MANNYIAYHVHSYNSLLDSCTDFKEYVDLAVQNGQTAIASTEHGKPLNWISKKMYCDEKGIKFIHGVEIYLTRTLEEKIRDNYHTVLLAKNLDGVKELNALVSRSCDKEHFYYNNRITFEEFLNISPNILSTSACLASPLNRLAQDDPWFMLLAQKYDYLEVQAHDHPDQIAFNKRLYKLSEALGKPLIAGTDTHSSTQYKAECRDILLRAKRKRYDDDGFDLTYKTYDELVEMFRRQDTLPEEVYLQAIENTNRLTDECEAFELDKSIKYPILYGSSEADDEKFTETVETLFKEKVETGIIPPEQVDAFRSAIDEEMRVFRKLKMTGFMLSMSELIRWCKSQGMAIGTARGSVGGSRVAYVTDIIDLNPETWHTVFSRFCNEDRTEIGDIDIDVVESDRPAIFKHIISRFGADKTGRVASFGTVMARGVIDEVMRARMFAWNEEHGLKFDEKNEQNPYTYALADQIKSELPQGFDEAVKSAKKKGKPITEVEGFPELSSRYPEVFYYFDGLWGTKVSQSVHPAGMVISPISLVDNYGMFDKDGENCLMMDMEEAHEVGAAKYDFLVLKTVQVIRDTCRYIGRPYPKTYEIDWNDQAVWEDMVKSPVAIFQFEGNFAYESLKKFKPQSIFDMSIVTACIRPSGASYRDQLLSRKPHKNPSEIIDNLLEENLGYLIYQEDTIKFLQQICGLSGSEADNIRRAIGRKQRDRLEKALPSILDGYCSKSPKPREESEKEAKEFLQIIEDSASYQFGYNHSIAYCLLGYLCAYFRYYYPVEFITAFLNDAANEDDIVNGTALAKLKKIRITPPKFGLSKSDYFFDKGENIIAKGLSSVKFMSEAPANELYELARNNRLKYDYFVDLLKDISSQTSLNSRQLDILLKIDYFGSYGTQRELFAILKCYNLFKGGEAKKVRRDKIDGTALEEIVRKNASCLTKAGEESKSYTITNMDALLRECEDKIRSLNLEDISLVVKAQNYNDIMGHAGFVTGDEGDRNKLYISDVYPVRRKKDNVTFGYSIAYQSLGSGKEGRMTVFKTKYEKDPIRRGDIIVCKRWERDGAYFRMLDHEHIVA